MKNYKDYMGVGDKVLGSEAEMGLWVLYLRWECQKNAEQEAVMVQHGVEGESCVYADRWIELLMGERQAVAAWINSLGHRSGCQPPPFHDVVRDRHREAQSEDES
jgi:hypothetical protein